MHAETFNYWLDLVSEELSLSQFIDSDEFRTTDHVICKAKIKDLLEIRDILETLEPAVLNKGVTK